MERTEVLARNLPPSGQPQNHDGIVAFYLVSRVVVARSDGDELPAAHFVCDQAPIHCASTDLSSHPVQRDRPACRPSAGAPQRLRQGPRPAVTELDNATANGHLLDRWH